VREFLVRFPTAGFQQMIERRHQQRMIEQRLRTYRAEPSQKGEVLCYSEVICEEGGVAQSSRHFGFFFALDGHDYLIEDHYCVNPACDCRTVHLEFWERTESGGRSPRVEVEQLLMATVTLAGDFQRIDFSKDSQQAAEKIARTWCDRCGHQLPEMGRRYEQVKAIGRRSFPADTDTARRRSSAAAARRGHVPAAAPPSDAGVGRNDPCPCGSGRKFKRCCARR
jgi:hypothetical protein